MQEFYPLLGRPITRFPSCLLRSYLLSIVLKVDSITEWCMLLKITPLYTILSGFLSHNTPGAGTLYDFFNRLWQSDKNNYINQVKHKKAKPKKGKKRGDKTLCDTDSAAANKSFHSLTATGDGILPEINFFGYHLYMFVADDSESDFPVFPMLERASKYAMLSFPA